MARRVNEKKKTNETENYSWFNVEKNRNRNRRIVNNHRKNRTKENLNLIAKWMVVKVEKKHAKSKCPTIDCFVSKFEEKFNVESFMNMKSVISVQ